MKKFLLALSLPLLLTGCAVNEDTGSTVPDSTDPTTNAIDLNVSTEGWVTLQGQGFSVMAPQGWVLTPAQGIDSYVGSISGDGLTLNFDYGMNAGDEFKDQSKEYVSSQENIGGKEGIIYLPRNTIEGTLGLFLQASETASLSISGEAGSANERLVLLEVLRSVSFQ